MKKEGGHVYEGHLSVLKKSFWKEDGQAWKRKIVTLTWGLYKGEAKRRDFESSRD